MNDYDKLCLFSRKENPLRRRSSAFQRFAHRKVLRTHVRRKLDFLTRCKITLFFYLATFIEHQMLCWRMSFSNAQCHIIYVSKTEWIQKLFWMLKNIIKYQITFSLKMLYKELLNIFKFFFSVENTILIQFLNNGK